MKGEKQMKRIFALTLVMAMLLTAAFGCTIKGPDDGPTGEPTAEPILRYDGAYSDTDGAYYAVDDLGRVVATDSDA